MLENLVRKGLLGSGAVPSISGLARLGRFGELSSLGTDVPVHPTGVRKAKEEALLTSGYWSPLAGLRCEGGQSGWLRLALTVGTHSRGTS